jgi:hypothetical protein
MFIESLAAVLGHTADTRNVQSLLYANTQPIDPFGEVKAFTDMIAKRGEKGFDRVRVTIVLTAPNNLPSIAERARPIEHMGPKWEDRFDPRVLARRDQFWAAAPIAKAEFSPMEREHLNMVYTALACNTIAHEEFRAAMKEVFALRRDYSTPMVLVHNGIIGAMAMILPFEATENTQSVEMGEDDKLSLQTIHPMNTRRLSAHCFDVNGKFTTKHIEYLANEMATYLKTGARADETFDTTLDHYRGRYSMKRGIFDGS